MMIHLLHLILQKVIKIDALYLLLLTNRIIPISNILIFRCIRFSRGSNFIIGFATLCIDGATIYYAKSQADQATLNTFEMRRQNDLEKVSQGLMSKEEYNRRYQKTII